MNLLSALLYNKTAWSMLSSQLYRELFYGSHHRYVFDALAALFSSHSDVTYPMLSDELRKREGVGAETSDHLLQQLELYEKNAVNAIRYAEIVFERYQQREAWFVDNEYHH